MRKSTRGNKKLKKAKDQKKKKGEKNERNSHLLGNILQPSLHCHGSLASFLLHQNRAHELINPRRLGQGFEFLLHA